MNRSRWLAVAVILSIPLVVVTFILGVGRPANVAAVGGNSGSFGGTGVWMVAQFGFLLAGALIASRHPGNSVGWLFFLTGALGLVSSFSNEYALQGYEGSELPALDAASWLASCASFFITPIFALLLLRFPTGRPPSPRWRWNEWLVGLSLLLGAAASVAFWFHRGPLLLQPDIDEVAGAQVGVMLASLVFMTATVASLASLVSMFFRYRKASADERLQLKWFAYAAAIAFVSILIGPVFQLTGEGNENLVTAAAGLLLPASAGVAILKYRLYDIDVVINKTIVFGVLAAFITMVYVAIVVGLGAAFGSQDEPNLALSIAATAIVAIAFSPVKDRTQRVANRLVYGHRLSPYEVLTDLSRSVATAPGPREVLKAVAHAACLGINAHGATVSLLIGEGKDFAVSYPDDLPQDNHPSQALTVTHNGEELGGLSITKRANDPITSHDRDLLDRLATQAGLALYNARLAVELQARLDEISAQADELQSSRARIVSAADDSRRRLEEDITSGPRSDLVSLQSGLEEARRLMETDAEAGAVQLELLGEKANVTLNALRELARGIYPPLLADRGVVAALEAHIRKQGLDVALHVDEWMQKTRFDESTETAVYFCCVEALRGSQTVSAIRLRSTGDGVEVGLEGLEIDPSALIEITDRVDALGGTTTPSGSSLVLRLNAREAVTAA